VPHGRPSPTPAFGLVILCITETVSWGLLYYSLPTASQPISVATGWSPSLISAGFSAGLITSAIAGIPAGRLLDARGPGLTMTIGSVLGGLGLVCVAIAPNLIVFCLAWLIVGLAGSMVLYQTAFSVITHWYQERRVRPLTIVTLAGGLASTIFAPLVAFLVTELGWRQAYLVLALILVVVTVPLHALLFGVPWHGHGGRPKAVDREHVRRVTRSGRFVILQAAMAVMALGVFAVTINLVPLLIEHGASYQVAAVGLGILGVGQVAGRIGFVFIPRRLGPGSQLLIIGSAAALTLVGLGYLPGPVSLLIGVGFVAGMARGCKTLLQATAVADRWGTTSFGTINGVFAAPVTAATAVAPVVGAGLGGVLGYPLMSGLMAALVAVAAVAGWRT
jgi:MFS family permease